MTSACDTLTLPMRVALDGTPLTVPTGGIRRYTEQLSIALAAAFPEDSLALFSDRELSDSPPGIELRASRPANWILRRWWSIGLPRALSEWPAEVFHGTDFAVPYRRVCPAVITVHDLSPWRDPEGQLGSERVRRRTPVLLRRSATMVITPSRCVQDEVVERFGVAPERVIATLLAAAPHFAPRPPAADKRYFVFAGTLEKRKNLDVLLAAWRDAAIGAELWIAGRSSGAPLVTPPGVRLLGAVSDNELVSLYSGALAFVFPSLYEGFGLPVLEAMQCGAPVIASDIGAVREVAGDAAIRLNPRDIGAWIEAIQAVALDTTLRADLRERGLRRAAEFSWQSTALETHEVYDEAIRRFHA